MSGSTHEVRSGADKNKVGKPYIQMQNGVQANAKLWWTTKAPQNGENTTNAQNQ